MANAGDADAEILPQDAVIRCPVKYFGAFRQVHRVFAADEKGAVGRLRARDPNQSVDPRGQTGTEFGQQGAVFGRSDSPHAKHARERHQKFIARRIAESIYVHLRNLVAAIGDKASQLSSPHDHPLTD